MNPYLSIVAASRNDNHGGDLTKRMTLFLKGLYFQLKKYDISCEIILVEWNPPGENKPLKDILPKPSSKNITLRIITVDNKIHRAWKTGEFLPLFQMIAKNVGIRRAKAPFILCTNVDLLFSDALMKFLSKKTLQQGTLYRCNRCDIPKEVDYDKDVPLLLDYARRNIQQRLGKNRWYPNFAGQSQIWYHNILIQLFVVFIAFVQRLYESKDKTMIASADTWACGDFTLMHKEHWHAIKGYFELDAYSIHIDSLALFAAYSKGVKQKILPASHCTYHISHKSGWEMQNPLEKIYFDIKMPMLDWNTQAKDACEYMYLNKEVLSINDDNWGLKNESLSEVEFTY